MAVFSFTWRSGAHSGPIQPPGADDVVWYEDDSQTFEKGYPVNIDLSLSSSGTVVFKKADSDADIVLFIASRDAGTGSADIDMDDYTADSDRPYLVQTNDIWSATISSAGTNGTTSSDNLGALYSWVQSVESGETNKAVLDSADTTYTHWAVVGFDDRDSIGTSGGRLLVMYVGGGASLTAAAQA